MGAITDVLLVVGLELLTEGVVTARGVLVPEAAIGAGTFFTALTRYCPGVDDPADMVVVTRSWSPDPAATYRCAVTLGAP